MVAGRVQGGALSGCDGHRIWTSHLEVARRAGPRVAFPSRWRASFRADGAAAATGGGARRMTCCCLGQQRPCHQPTLLSSSSSSSSPRVARARPSNHAERVRVCVRTGARRGAGEHSPEPSGVRSCLSGVRSDLESRVRARSARVPLAARDIARPSSPASSLPRSQDDVETRRDSSARVAKRGRRCSQSSVIIVITHPSHHSSSSSREVDDERRTVGPSGGTSRSRSGT